MKIINFEDKWKAILLSFLIPGSGHLWVGHWYSVVWFVLAALLSVALRNVFLEQSFLSILCGVFSFIILGFLSAQQIKSWIERRQKVVLFSIIQEDVVCHKSVNNKVDIGIKITVPLSQKKLWSFISDLEHFLLVDPLHKKVHVESERRIKLEHQVLWYRFNRYGKILYWDEGKGYAFSDISSRGPKKGFPHVFYVHITSEVEDVSQLHIRVKGKWTEQWIPKFFRNVWIENMCREHSLLLLSYLSEKSQS